MMVEKKCSRCGVVKSLSDFHREKAKKDGLKSACKECILKSQIAYLQNERAHIITVVASIFKPSSCKKRGLWPVITRQQIWEELMIYIQDMKEKFPGSDGRICSYCEQPWTNSVSYGGIKEKNLSNFSIDRIDNTKTYTLQNIVFCCAACNDNKHSATLKLMSKTLEIAKERNLI